MCAPMTHNTHGTNSSGNHQDTTQTQFEMSELQRCETSIAAGEWNFSYCWYHSRDFISFPQEEIQNSKTNEP